MMGSQKHSPGISSAQTGVPILAPEFETKLAELYYEELAAMGYVRGDDGSLPIVKKTELQDAMTKACRRILEGTYR